MAITIFGLTYPDPDIHDKQHLWASSVALILGLSVFVTYYFMSRVEAQNPGRPWKMPLWYFIIGAILFAFTASAIACTLSIVIRSRNCN